nr:hypothetical protein BaRGS_030588 [Batillaria attramentaria]
MTSVTMSNGFLTPTRGKEPTIYVTSHDGGGSGDAGGKPEGEKIKPKKKAKDGAKAKKLKKTPNVKISLKVGDKIPPAAAGVEVPAPAKKIKTVKEAQILRQAFQPTDIFDSHSSHENSPGQLVIAEAEGRAQEREEERQARLRSIDESISTVIRDSVLEVDQRDKGAESSTSNRPASATGEKKKTKKQKEKVKLKSSEFVHDDVIKREEEEDMTARSEKSMNDTINAVIRKGMEHTSQDTSGTAKSEEPAQAQPTTGKKSAKKEGKKKKVEKDKSPAVKKKLKEKLKPKSGKAAEPSLPAVEQKPFVSDKYSSEELRVYEFEVVVTSPVDVKPLLIKSPTPDTAVAASSASTSSVTSTDQPPIKPLKIEIPKEKEKHKDRDKSRDKEKKEKKRRDKEKKKKNKDKDRDRDRHEKHHDDRSKDEKSSVAENPGFKIKIKLGSAGGSSSSVTVTENKASPVDTAVKQETVTSPPRPEIPKLVIRRDAGDGGSSQKKHTSRLAKSTPPTLSSMKMEPSDSPPPPALELSPSGSPSPALPGGSSRGQRSGVEAETVGFFIDESGQKIWICPACKLQDDGSPMIGCDKCDDWYHWVCVNIVQEPPEDEQWYCPRCNAKARAKPKAFKPKGKRGRKKKNPV